MNSPGHSDPRWGQQDRDKKAAALLRTVEIALGDPDAARSGHWLDIGCGSGGVAASLAASVARVSGIDPESWDRWADYEGAHSNLMLKRGSYRDLDAWMGPAAIDVVVCNQVYEHVEDADALIEAIARVLKPGGTCYFAGPNLLWPIEPHVFWPFVHWLPRSFAQHAMRTLGSRHAQELDAFSWSYWRLRRSFRRAGLDVRGAIHERLVAAAELTPSLPLRLMAALPRTLVEALTPLSPGFVFLLHRPS